jgi:hypothetical protein
MPSPKQFCGYCGLPVMKHRDSTGFINGMLYHKKRCRAKYLKEVRKQRRSNAKKEPGELHRVPTRLGTDRRNSSSPGQPSTNDPGV